MRRQMIVVGASGHAKVVADIFSQSGHEFMDFLDDKTSSDPLGCNLVGHVSYIKPSPCCQEPSVVNA